jgi:hypothetical protein
VAILLTAVVSIFLLIRRSAWTPTAHSRPVFSATKGTPMIDGSPLDVVWGNAPWLPINHYWLGAPPPPTDFQGRYKIAWDENNLYLLVEITDDSLADTHADGLMRYWDDDCLEVFLDEDASGGLHQYSYNAFAYHIALDGRVVDIAPDSSFRYFNDHCTTRRITTGKTSVWEVAVRVFDGTNLDSAGIQMPKSLFAGKKMGFALAYCDKDTASEREHFIGNLPISGADKNRGWVDASIFGLLAL